MRKRRVLGFVWAALLLASTGSAVGKDLITLTRQDQQTLLASAYAPTGPSCRGIALVSPGAGGSEQGYGYLGRALSSFGYLAVVVGHQESGREAVREAVRSKGVREGLAALITNPQAYRARFMDLAAARQWASARCEGTEKILVGHSMGAATVMVEAGARNKLGLSGADTFDAYIALSPQGSGLIFDEGAWSTISRPMLTITGTQDTELESGTWQARTEPFAGMPAGCKWLAVLDGATHMQLAGIGAPQKMQALLMLITGAFLDGLRRGDCTGHVQQDGVVMEMK